MISTIDKVVVLENCGQCSIFIPERHTQVDWPEDTQEDRPLTACARECGGRWGVEGCGRGGAGGRSASLLKSMSGQWAKVAQEGPPGSTSPVMCRCFFLILNKYPYLCPILHPSLCDLFIQEASKFHKIQTPPNLDKSLLRVFAGGGLGDSSWIRCLFFFSFPISTSSFYCSLEGGMGATELHLGSRAGAQRLWPPGPRAGLLQLGELGRVSRLLLCGCHSAAQNLLLFVGISAKSDHETSM